MSNERAPAKFAVFGDPISHSLSPRIHAQFGAQLGIGLSYVAIQASSSGFADAVQAFASSGGRGANITLPLKQVAIELCAERSDFAARVGAVNTLSRLPDGRWRGDNTDGSGFIRDLSKRHALNPSGRRCLMLGAGGAARAVACALLEAGIAELVIVNRTPARADVLAGMLAEPARVHVRHWQQLDASGRFELIVNATSAGHGRRALEIPDLLVAPEAICYDLSYGAASIAFLSWARGARARHAVDGLGMLVEQAADAFALWHGVRPQTGAIHDELRAEVPLTATP